MLISLEEAAVRLGVPAKTLEKWGEIGLLNIQERACLSNLHPDLVGLSPAERCVEEGQLANVAESLGWLSLSANDWDGPKDPT